MKNYISKTFFEDAEKIVFVQRQNENQIEFDPNEIDLSISKIENNEVILDQSKVEAKAAKTLAKKYRKDRKAEYEKQGLNKNKYLEMLIENDTAGMAEYKAKRDAIKLLFPKSGI